MDYKTCVICGNYMPITDFYMWQIGICKRCASYIKSKV